MKKRKGKVYEILLILGKTPNYDENGILKNRVIKAKYTGERELSNLIDDTGYRSLGACKVVCVDCWDINDKEEKFPEMVKVVNDRITGTAIKEAVLKTPTDEVKEEMAKIRKELDELRAGKKEVPEIQEVPKPPADTPDTPETPEVPEKKEQFTEPPHKRAFQFMKKTDLIEYGKLIGLELDVEVKKPILIDDINSKIEELKAK